MPEIANITEFGTLREKVGLSITEAAEIIGKNERTIRRYEDSSSSGSQPSILAINAIGVSQ